MTRASDSTPPRLTLGGCALLAAIIAIPCCGRGPARAGQAQRPGAKVVIQNKGSDTMVNVAQLWAEEYRHVAPEADVEVSGGGSGVGIAALIKGAVDIANASRDMKPEEIEEAKRNNQGQEPKEFVVGHDALAVYVHKSNPLNEISLDSLADIYGEHGTVTRWSQLGVEIPGVRDDRIVRISRQSSSGTYEFFREQVLDQKDFKLGSLDLNGSKEVVELVGATKTAIGYSGMGYDTDAVKMLGLSRDAGGIASAPSVDNVFDKQYPLARSLLIYTLGEPQGAVKMYIDWIMSETGQKILEESGFVPISRRRSTKS
ncbi:MAG: phosphate ABC transporter substrate-binding protein [Vicinamibacteria bacterium]|nr:phosphate ABC transporter substrate-binding protein [Vicinamibacteria bacterium]